MGKKKKKEHNCHDCENAMYICEGDYICDLAPAKLVISDWIPTENFNMCNRHKYVCPKCKNTQHKPNANFCKICGDKIKK